MKRRREILLDGMANWLLALFALERLLKLVAVWHFFSRFRRPERSRRSQNEQDPQHHVTRQQSWPSVTLLQPITRGASNLAAALHARATLDYPAAVQHLLICDRRDATSQQVVSDYLREFPGMQAEALLVEPGRAGASVASKMRKLQSALPHATGEVLCFIDDDVTLRPDALRILIPYLSQEKAGVAFGLPCFTNWQNSWSGLVSGLVNAHMLPNFVAIAYCNAGIRINGHIFAFRRETFRRIGGLIGLEQQIDDEYEIARRVRQHGLRAIQTPLVYDIDNALDSAQAYARQLKRWFAMPRQAMMPSLSLKERLIFGLFSFTLPFPCVLALLAILSGRAKIWRNAALSLALFGMVYAIIERRYLQRPMPLSGWRLLPIVALGTPLHILWILLQNNEVEWRGQRLRLHRDGRAEVLAGS